MPRVYRIETEDGTGPWVNGDGAYVYREEVPNMDWASSEMHPSPRDEGGEVWNAQAYREWHCGLATLGAVLDWFPHARGRSAMVKVGYAVTEYDAPDVVYGRRQCMIDKTTAVPVRRIDLLELDGLVDSCQWLAAS